MKVVVRLDPFQLTLSPFTKPVPLTVKVKSGPPGPEKLGLILVIAGGALLTCCGIVLLILSSKVVPSPRYKALIECEPIESAVVEKVAVPAVTLAIPIGVPPSEN